MSAAPIQRPFQQIHLSIIPLEKQTDAGFAILIDAPLGNDFIREIKIQINLGVALAGHGHIGVDVLRNVFSCAHGSA